MPQIGKGMTAEQARKLLGAPDHTSRQILYRRYLEQWSYDHPAGLWIELDCVKGQDPRVIGAEEMRSCNFADGEHDEADMEPALERHGNTLRASASTGFGYTPRINVASAVTPSGTTIHGTSTTASECEPAGSSSKYARNTMGPR